MKRIVFVPLGALLLFVATAAGAQTVDEILAKHYQTRGGLEKWKTIETVTMTGTAMAQGMEIGLAIYSKRPNLARQEVYIQIPGGPSATIVSVFDGTAAWLVNPMMGSDAPVRMEGAEGEMFKDQADFDSALLDYRAKGHSIELVGAETVNGRKAHHLKVTRKSGPVQHYYLDAETGVEARIVTEAGATGMAVDVVLSDYRAVDGIQMPFTIRQESSGQLVELKIQSVEFNKPIDNAWFKIGGTVVEWTRRPGEE
jgi:outer membrane lipoprotein-sorting protein